MPALSAGSDAQSAKHAGLSLTCRCLLAIIQRAAAANSSISRDFAVAACPPVCPFLELSCFYVGCEGELGPVRPQIDSSAWSGTAFALTCVCLSDLRGKRFAKRSGSDSSGSHSVARATKATPGAKTTCYINSLTEKMSVCVCVCACSRNGNAVP